MFLIPRAAIALLFHMDLAMILVYVQGVWKKGVHGIVAYKWRKVQEKMFFFTVVMGNDLPKNIKNSCH
jgi:hypothetical protein